MAERIAIIGTGIAGMGVAHFLHVRADLVLYEKNTYVGGHTNTVTADEDGTSVPIDTGFMVFNDVTYPYLLRLFRELNVPVKPTSMSFSVQHVPSGLEWSGSSINHLFAQRRNLFRPSFVRFLLQVNRFNQESPKILDDASMVDVSLADYVRQAGFGEDFVHHYLIPMSSAVWSTPPDKMLRFPAATLVRFFKNHGFLGLDTQHQWYTVDGGSREYRERLIAPFRDRIRVGVGAARVTRTKSGVEVRGSDGSLERFDKVVLAGHADESLEILDAPTDMERRLLSAFTFQPNTATLHTDESVMPRTRLAWSSWNYRTDAASDGSSLPSTVYWMNSLQGVSKRRNYFVSINDPGKVDPSKVLRRIEYTHPVFTVESGIAQRGLDQLNANGPVYFSGAWFRYGFHEDGLLSAVRLVRQMTGEAIWS
ncbi:MAG: FAD-dependent oxidoreductase [Bacteroidetes bacterium]|jgi:predicted NAD/FAD-binding protein|nr:FAD-dependent oxidoreductase [Bacteroidota bacterium]